MPLIAIIFLLGVIFATSLPFLLPLWLIALLPISLWIWIYQPRLRWLGIFITAALWSVLQMHWMLSPSLPSDLEGKDLRIQGQVINIPSVYPNKVRFMFKPLTNKTNKTTLPDKIRLSWYKNAPDLKAGDIWELTVRLKQPHGFANPAGFDYETWLFQQGIRAAGYVRHTESARQLHQSAGSINRFRQDLANRITSQFEHQSTAGLLIALTLGLRDRISSQQWNTLIQTGTNHLIAISGLHIGLIAGFGFFLFRHLWHWSPRLCLWIPAQKAAWLFSLIPATLYALMAGLSIPTQRALIMLTVVIIGKLIWRKIQPANLLATALLIILIVNSLAILSPGFWLSFAAVAAILWITQSGFKKIIWQAIRIQLFIILALMPLTLWFFDQASLVAPLANMVAVPLVGMIIMPLLFCALMIMPIAQTLGWAVFTIAGKSLEWLMVYLDWLAGLPMAYWQHSSNLISIVLALLGVAILLAFRGLPGRWLSPILFLPLLLHKPATPQHGEFKVSVLDVGQGLSTLIQTQHHLLIYDTGNAFSTRFNSANSVILPTLRQLGIKQVDTLILSHDDSDHIGAYPMLRDGIDIQRILSTQSDMAAPLEPCQSDIQWQWDSVYFKILHPSKGFTAKDNDLSCVLSVENAAGRALFPGDITTKVERQLIEQYPDQLISKLLVAPHHGSLTSSSKTFINAVKPDHAVFTVGYRNRYSLPNAKVISRYQNIGSELYRSDDDGNIQFLFTQDGLDIKRYRQTHRRPWKLRE